MSKRAKTILRTKDIERELELLLESSDDSDSDDELADVCNADFEGPCIDTVLDNIQELTQEQLIDILSEPTPFSNNTHATPDSIVASVSTDENTNLSCNDTNVTMETTYSPFADHPVKPNLTYSELQNKSRVWSTQVPNLTLPKFDGKLQATKEYSNRCTPLLYFQNLFTEELLDLIVTYTNKYAMVKKTKFWRDTNIAEIKAFLAIIIMMGISPHSDIELYWSSDEFYNNPVISGIMSLKRFRKLLETIHCCDVSDILPITHPNVDKLQHIRPMLTMLNRSYQNNATHSQCQSIDESMIKFKGRDSKKQYMPGKPIKRGYKAWCRCDASTGYLYEVDIYKGKCDEASEEGLGYRVVKQLSQQVPKNTLLVFDNFFTSPALMEYLYDKGIFSIGTVRMNRKGLPSELIDKKKLPPSEKVLQKENRLSPGEFTYRYSEPMSVIKWRDTKDVHVLTTAIHPREIKEIQRKQKDGSKKDMYCPKAIVEYTRNMGGVDHFDHYRSSYSIGRKNKKSWMRLFWFLFESAVINTYIIYKNGNESRKNIHRDFRLRLARGLVGGYKDPSKQSIFYFRNKKGSLGVPDEIRLGRKGEHWLVKSSYKRCRYCSTKKKEKRSNYMCKICKVNLCVLCSEKYHSNNV